MASSQRQRVDRAPSPMASSDLMGGRTYLAYFVRAQSTGCAEEGTTEHELRAATTATL